MTQRIYVVTTAEPDSEIVTTVLANELTDGALVELRQQLAALKPALVVSEREVHRIFGTHAPSTAARIYTIAKALGGCK